MSDDEHYFHATPPDPSVVTRMTVQLAGREVEVDTAPKVFSHARLDLGTRVLLREVPSPPAQGTILDLGCGWGPLALTIALQSPAATVWAVDVNERALTLVRSTATRLKLDHVHAARPDDVPEDLRFDVIWSNPPIRIGKAALHQLLRTWLPGSLRADAPTSWCNATSAPIHCSGGSIPN